MVKTVKEIQDELEAILFEEPLKEPGEFVVIACCVMQALANCVVLNAPSLAKELGHQKEIAESLGETLQVTYNLAVIKAFAELKRDKH